MDFRGSFIFFPFSGHFFAPVKLGAVFHLIFHVFPISGFQPFSDLPFLGFRQTSRTTTQKTKDWLPLLSPRKTAEKQRKKLLKILKSKDQGISLVTKVTVSGSTPTPWSGPIRDHSLNPPLSTENPRNKGFSGSGAPIFGFGLADPAPKG